MSNDFVAPEPGLREVAITRLRKKRELLQHLTAFAVINGALVLIWMFTTPGGFFWPLFPLLIWGIGVVFHLIDVYAPGQPSEERIQREMGRITRHS